MKKGLLRPTEDQFQPSHPAAKSAQSPAHLWDPTQTLTELQTPVLTTSVVPHLFHWLSFPCLVECHLLFVRS